jgi:hypothetical protein
MTEFSKGTGMKLHRVQELSCVKQPLVRGEKKSTYGSRNDDKNLLQVQGSRPQMEALVLAK